MVVFVVLDDWVLSVLNPAMDRNEGFPEREEADEEVGSVRVC
jgi:hypothetical protein